MGIYSNAELIYGIPILAFDEDRWDDEQEQYEATPFWSVEDEYWIDAPTGLKIVNYGHYEDPDNYRAILSIKGVKHYSGDCWDLTGIDPSELAIPSGTHEAGNNALRAAGLPGNFFEAKWYLVASVG